jgi:hypothetical protein
VSTLIKHTMGGGCLSLHCAVLHVMSGLAAEAWLQAGMRCPEHFDAQLQGWPAQWRAAKMAPTGSVGVAAGAGQRQL